MDSYDIKKTALIQCYSMLPSHCRHMVQANTHTNMQKGLII